MYCLPPVFDSGMLELLTYILVSQTTNCIHVYTNPTFFLQIASSYLVTIFNFSMSAFQLSLFQKLLNFAIVAASGLCIDFSITWLCREKLRFNQYVANAAGFSIAACSKFLLNDTWTFKGVSGNTVAAFGSFVFIALLGLILNTGAVYLCHELVKVEFYRSKLMAVVLMFLWNLGANYLVTFHS